MRISDWSSDVCSSDLQMADQHILSDDRRIAFGAVRHRPVAMDDAAVLDVAAGADADLVDVGAQHAIIPDADIRADHHVADDAAQYGSAHVCTPVTNAHHVSRLLLEKKKP